MDSRSLARAGGVSLAALLIIGAAAAEADTFVGGTNVWSMIGVPSFSATGTPRALVEYSNGLSTNVTGIVIMVLRNSAGQTVYYTTGTLTVPGERINSAALVEFGLPGGTYNATFFAITFSGLPISTSNSALFTLP